MNEEGNMGIENEKKKSALLPLKASHTEFVESKESDDKLKKLLMKLKKTE